MAIITGSERAKAKQDALRRSLGMDPKRDITKKKHGRRVKSPQSGHRKASRETRQTSIS